jgi:hypothetical protein
MSADVIALGEFRFQQFGDRMFLRAPRTAVETSAPGFLAGIRHLLTMKLDLEGQAELDGGLVVRVQGEQVRLKLGDYAQHFPIADVTRCFQVLAGDGS